MKRLHKNPSVCEYCYLLNSVYSKATGHKDKRRVLARFKLHRKAIHSNPPKSSKLRQRAIAIAKQLYKHFKGRGVPAFVMNKIPGSYRSIVEQILKYNGIAVKG